MANIKSNVPYSVDAEKAILGAALIDTDSAISIFSEFTEPSWFYIEKHQLIYKAMLNLNSQGKEINSVTLASELDTMKILEKIGGVDYLAECSDSMVALSSLRSYMDVVSKYGTLRKILTTIRKIDGDYLAENVSIDNIDDFISSAEANFRVAIDSRKVSSFERIATTATQVQEHINRLKYSETGLEEGACTTGFKNLDAICGGFRRKEVIIMAARPGLGKTALALNFAYNVASKSNKSVAIFSLEMARELLLKRLISSRSLVSLKKITTGDLNGVDRTRITSAINEISGLDIYLDDTPRIKIGEVANKLRQLSKQVEAVRSTIGLVVVDYVGLVETGLKVNKNESRSEEVRILSAQFKALASELNVPILLLCQLNRNTEAKGDKPKISDLRDSGSLEQDADVVLLLHRGDYQKDSKSEDTSKFGDKKPRQLNIYERFDALRDTGKLGEIGAGGSDASTSLLEVIVGKNRNGSTGSVYLSFHKGYQNFSQLSEETEKKLKDAANFDFND